MSISVEECYRVREVFLAAYCHATRQGNGHDLAVRLGLDAVWMAGRQYQAARQETPAQSATRDMDERQDLERQCYIDAVVRLLKKADLRKVDLVWVYASHLIKEVNGRAE